MVSHVPCTAASYSEIKILSEHSEVRSKLTNNSKLMLRLESNITIDERMITPTLILGSHLSQIFLAIKDHLISFSKPRFWEVDEGFIWDFNGFT